MKVFIPALLLITASATCGLSQHPLVGTWEMISVKGTDANGEAFYLDTTSVRETKIITPTHYMLIAWDVEGDSLIFNRTMAGNVALQGQKYVESPTHASVEIFENVEAQFNWKLEGDIFTQSGFIVRPDGKRVILEALKFRKVRHQSAKISNPAIATWLQESGHYVTEDGQKQTSFNKADSRLLIVTPTHWMSMDLRSNSFQGAIYGTYNLNGSEGSASTIFSTYATNPPASDFSQKVSGDRLQLISRARLPDGKTATFFDEYRRAGHP